MTIVGTPSTQEPSAQTTSAAGARRRRRWPLYVLLALAAVLSPVAWSLGHALAAPGTDSVSARIAEWGRDHHAGWLVTWLEKTTYTPPKVGGAPPTTSPIVHAIAPVSAPRALGLPAAVVSPATPALPGEGTWHVLATSHGRAALAAAYVRPDAMHTSYTAGIAWINPQLVRAVFHPGSQQPGGGPWPEAPLLTANDRTGLLAAFNSAFRLQDARGGFYGWGRTVAPLRTGAASLVITRGGRIDVGAWGSEVRMHPNVVAVRQNLDEIVDNGAPVPGLARNVGGQWGWTLGNSKYVWRTGIGVRADGSVVFVTGNRLSAPSLADLMVRAGVVRGMELDINPEWTSFVLYRTPTGQQTESNLLPDMQRPARRYDATSSRDFVALYLR